MNERTWRFFEWDENRWELEHGDGMSVTVLYSNESNRAFLLRILNTHDALVAALEDLEWVAVDGVPRCPSCWGWQGDGDHKDDCHLVAALRLAMGEAS